MDKRIEQLTNQLSEDIKAFSKDPNNLKDGYTYEKEFVKLMTKYESELLSASLGASVKDRNKKKLY